MKTPLVVLLALSCTTTTPNYDLSQLACLEPGRPCRENSESCCSPAQCLMPADCAIGTCTVLDASP